LIYILHIDTDNLIACRTLEKAQALAKGIPNATAISVLFSHSVRPVHAN
jgi:hypothetical protein